MSKLGIDYGESKIGLAKSAGSLAVPLTILRGMDMESAVEAIGKICTEEGIEEVVVGMPLSMRGTEVREADIQNGQVQHVQKFIQLLSAHVDIPVVIEDERLSTQMARELLKGHARQDDDAVAAMVVLQSYLDKQSG